MIKVAFATLPDYKKSSSVCIQGHSTHLWNIAVVINSTTRGMKRIVPNFGVGKICSMFLKEETIMF